MQRKCTYWCMIDTVVGNCSGKKRKGKRERGREGVFFCNGKKNCMYSIPESIDIDARKEKNRR